MSQIAYKFKFVFGIKYQVYYIPLYNQNTPILEVYSSMCHMFLMTGLSR